MCTLRKWNQAWVDADPIGSLFIKMIALGAVVVAVIEGVGGLIS